MSLGLLPPRDEEVGRRARRSVGPRYGPVQIRKTAQQTWMAWTSALAPHVSQTTIDAMRHDIERMLGVQVLRNPVTKATLELLRPSEHLTHEALDELASTGRGLADRVDVPRYIRAPRIAASPRRGSRAARTLGGSPYTWRISGRRSGSRTAVRAVVDLRRARRRRDTSWLSNSASRQVSGCVRLLSWLRDHGHDLSSCDQPQLDRWAGGNRSRALEARAFVRWAVRNHLAHGLSVRRGPDPIPVSTITLARQQQVASALLDNPGVPVADRLAGLLVVLYAQLFTRIARMRHTALAVADAPST